ncbi:hypothetical protein SNE25_12895 [Mucilaginibacter sabulilitoris]|uniref:Uncharacterized protein n=1 Tax=Mucilaginibacter sabulilitoris TaxID=1173583 RepID=A0ABZ0TU66_9SPHI|nr:hypothetical protein [Mucilaginibacter sabulilitoris]WPU96417.1 hypothetical protein SNE25_12895 [Mucilaginibacter sabulilitoris]
MEQATDKIKLSELDGLYGSIRKIRENVFKHVPISQLLGYNITNIVYYTLKQFNFRKPIPRGDVPAIEKACVTILTKTTYYIKGKIDPEFEREGPPYDPIQHYFKEILGFNKLPGRVFDELDALVRADLKEVMALIERYEAEPVIKTYLETGERRSQHEGKIRLDFYERCLAERDRIVKYLTSDLEYRALFKATEQSDRLSNSLMMFDGFRDRPYRWSQPYHLEYFDYKKINTCRHRLDEVVIRKIPALEKLYQIGKKTTFYSELQKLFPIPYLFEQIFNFYIPRNPKVAERLPVFKELRLLFKARRWYGFTALALTQVEGVFSDMTAIINPEKPLSSLSNKVLAVRPYYEYHERVFDYFEYILPRIRNRFLHSGSIGDWDFKIIAYDLIYDLHYILRVFLELKDNQVKLTNMLNGDLVDSISSLGAFNDLFEILKELRARQKSHPKNMELNELMMRWDDFEKNTLKDSGTLEYFADQVLTTLNELTTKFFETVYFNTGWTEKQIDLAGMKSKEVKEQLPEIKAVLTEYSWHFQEQVKQIMDMYAFLKAYKTYLPSFPATAAAKLNELIKQEKENEHTPKMHQIAPLFIANAK